MNMMMSITPIKKPVGAGNDLGHSLFVIYDDKER